MDDYLVCKAHNIPMRSFVDDDGKYTQDLPQFAGTVWLCAKSAPYCAQVSHVTPSGKFVLGAGNEMVIQALTEKGALLHQHKYMHKYPYDWRTKKPIIMRATEQWFIDLKDVVNPALDAISQVDMVRSLPLSLQGSRL